MKGRVYVFLLLWGLGPFPGISSSPGNLPTIPYRHRILQISTLLDFSFPEPTGVAALCFPGWKPGLSLQKIPVPGHSETGSARYQVFYRGIALENAVLSIRKNHSGNTATVVYPALSEAGIDEVPLPEKSTKSDFCLIRTRSGWELFQKIPRITKREAHMDYVDQWGILRFREDWLLRFRPSGPDSLIRATVFRPDPVARLRMPYGGVLRDRSDSNSVLLQSALDTVPLRVRFENDSFSLRNSRFRMGEFSIPIRSRAVFPAPDSFLLNRSRTEFEEINVFYHLNAFRKFQDSLGYGSLADYPLRVDAHGMDGADQSAYSPLQDILAYGEGNVDDGEDAAVVVHEYGHVLAHAALAFGNTGFERRAVEEGICDYLAGSYVRQQSGYEWQNLFKWDGHNEFWSGRTLVSTRQYPLQLTGQIHRDGEIFSSALMAMEGQLGRAAVHRLVFSSLPFLLPNFSMPQSARVFLESDSSLSGGQNTETILTAFLNRGIDPDQVIVSAASPESRSPWRLQSAVSGTEGWVLTTDIPEDIQIRLYQSNGRLVRSFEWTPSAHKTRIPSEGLIPGMYIIQLRSANRIESYPLLHQP